MNRKSPHFFFVNPISDRRIECRFESREKVVVLGSEDDHPFSAVAYDIGRRGLRIETDEPQIVGTDLQIQFEQEKENLTCFGRVVWSRPMEEGQHFEAGIAVHSWHGVVHGPESWKNIKGIKVKRDRRRKSR